MVSTLLWPFGRGNHFFVIVVQGFVEVWALTPRLGRERKRRQNTLHRLCFPSVPSIHDGDLLLHEVFPNEGVVRARAAVLDQSRGATTSSEMLAKLLERLGEFLVSIFVNANNFSRIHIVHNKERGLVVHFGLGPLLDNIRTAKFQEQVAFVQ